MQTLNRSTVASRSATRAARPARSAVVVRASAESRRAILSGLAAGVALVAAQSAQALTPVDLIDDRAAIGKGFLDIYEARDKDLPQAQRVGLTKARGDIDGTKQRVKESESRIDSALEPSIKKAYWTEAREELRRQVGSLRSDLNILASLKAGKEDKKKAQALKKDFIAQVENLDFALRQKNQDAALAKLSSTKTALDNVLAFVL